jgi:hypothetical protein
MIDLSLSNPNAMWGLVMGKDLEPKQRLLVTLAAAQIPATNSMGALYLKSPLDDLVKAQTDLTAVKSNLGQAQTELTTRSTELAQVRAELAQARAELDSLRRVPQIDVPNSVGSLTLKVAGGTSPKWTLQDPDSVVTVVGSTETEALQLTIHREKQGLVKIALMSDGFTRQFELKVTRVQT